LLAQKRRLFSAKEVSVRYMLFLVFVSLFLVGIPATGEPKDDDELLRFADAIEYGGKYALLEMRPTARFQSASVDRIRMSDKEDGGTVKARVRTTWITAFTGKTRTTVIDIWITPEGKDVYLTRYKLYSDDHNIPILNDQDARVKVKLVIGKKKDDF
jgi:hypothetical protein